MNKKIVVLGILKEVRIDENRTPFSPGQVSNILNKFSTLEYIKELNPTNYCIAGGGIEYMEDIAYYRTYGADSFSLGTVCFNPFKFRRLVSHVY